MRGPPAARAALFLIAFLVALVLLLPMRLAVNASALDARGISARAVRGSLWGGTIEDMHVGALPLGTLDAALSPFALLVGRARLDFARHGQGGGDLEGAITVGRNAVGIDDVTGAIPIAGLLAPLPVAALDLEDVSVRFVGGRCARAEGRVRARLAGAIPGLAPAQELGGRVRCEGTRARVSLAGRSGGARIALSVDATGRYAAEALVAEPDPALAAALIEIGFTRIPGGYRLRSAGAAE